ncbi:MAG: type II toxin-antitoxin system VapC family toxin [Armatimonadota bacterium]|nr:type II toxin-antitoxin system VapC family toxin [Armatimonadota bacterium]
MIYQLDTDHVSVFQRGGPGAVTLEARLRWLALDDYGTAIVTYEEQCRGWTAKINRARTAAERLEAYALLKTSLRYFCNIAVWDYTPAAEAIFTTLIQSKIRVGTEDLRIAAIALANGATLLSRNLRDFAKVPGLRVEDWTA